MIFNQARLFSFATMLIIMVKQHSALANNSSGNENTPKISFNFQSGRVETEGNYTLQNGENLPLANAESAARADAIRKFSLYFKEKCPSIISENFEDQKLRSIFISKKSVIYTDSINIHLHANIQDIFGARESGDQVFGDNKIFFKIPQTIPVSALDCRQRLKISFQNKTILSALPVITPPPSTDENEAAPHHIIQLSLNSEESLLTIKNKRDLETLKAMSWPPTKNQGDENISISIAVISH